MMLASLGKFFVSDQGLAEKDPSWRQNKPGMTKIFTLSIFLSCKKR